MKKLKLSLYSIVAVALTFSIVAHAESCVERSQRQYKSGMSAAPLIPVDFMSTIYREESLRVGVGRFVKELPNRYDQIFFENKDFSGQEILRHAEEAEKFWGSEAVSPTYESHFREFDFDYISYRDLTIQAVNVWKQLLSCNQNDVDVLRKNFFMGNPCGGATPENTTAIKSITELSVNYASFIRSSKIIASHKLDYSNRLLREMAEERGYFVRLTLPNQHPLLVQIQLQNWAVVVNSINERARADLQDFFITGGQIKDYIPRGQTASEFSAIQTWRVSLINSAVIATSNRDEDPMNLKNGTACSRLGLWPAMNRALFTFMKFGSYNALYLSQVSDLGESMRNYITKACGEAVEDAFVPTGERYSSFALAHLYEMKRLFARYWDQKVDQPYEKAMKQSGITPYQNLICTQ